ncbi:MAG: NAD(P)H-dependent glycerol-3-phosphate dehydrogenase [Elusimicrobiaceae bacterium]|nr:NAD(P)H-dependent glycerol-3-phosphate dehydrogenase [Elusimicrobiaceae bacterium]
MINKVAVFGAGVWGSVLAQHIAKQGRSVVVWEYFEHLVNKIAEHGGAHPHIPGFHFRRDIVITRDMDAALADADLILIVTSSKSVRRLAHDIGIRLRGKRIPVVSAAKGIEDESLLTLTEIIEQEIPAEKDCVMAFSGPSFALEVAHAMPTKIVLAGRNRRLLERTVPVFNSYPISVELSDDPTGVQWAGAAKNVLAIACGVAEGLGKTINTKAALVTLAMREMHDVVLAAGGTGETVYGLAGLGDFILTGTSTLSRNTRLGIKLGQGKALAQARGEINTVTEGADSVESIYSFACAKKLNVPLINAVHDIIRKGSPAETVLHALGF